MTLDKSYIPLKTSVDVARIRRSCRICEKILVQLSSCIREGVTTKELDSLAEVLIRKEKAKPVLKGYDGFPGSICTSVNNVVAHGIPSGYCLKDGDIITIDITIEKDGWYGDGAWTFITGKKQSPAKHLVKAAWQASLAGIMEVKAGSFLGNIGYSINMIAKKHGCSIVKEFVGHGIGKEMHEEPLIPHFGKPGTGRRIVPGMVFTIEPVLSLGKPDIIMTEQGWNCMTKDNSLTAQFENTIAVFKDRIEILTLSCGKLKDFIDYPPVL
ncbi:MAG: type I methionyl aminopeptidase [Spirochaetales bacterium]|nr:type I methionyl aminopeptidase [Spirochaetales bacterium]